MTSTTDTAVRERPSSLPSPHKVGRTRAWRWPRLVLMFAVPLAIVIGGGYWYLSTGRYVSTDDSYVGANTLTVSANVAARVVAIEVHNNEYVKAGQVLFRLNPASYQAADDLAKAELEAAKLQIEGMRATYRQRQSDLKAAQDTLAFAQREFDRQQNLLASHTVSQAQFDQARHALDAARQQVAGTQQAIASVLASLGGDPNIPTEKHPLVEQAAARLEQADINLGDTVIKAPENGIVTLVDKMPIGTYLTPAMPAFTLVGTDEVWVEANFKETDLGHMRVGQPATLDVDGCPDVTLKARVQSISPGTGSEFSVLPPQNATGNWVKVVQRLPVRIVAENPEPLCSLRAGMSVTAEVDTGYEKPLWRQIKSFF